MRRALAMFPISVVLFGSALGGCGDSGLVLNSGLQWSREASQMPIPPKKDMRIDQKSHALYSKYFCSSGRSGASKSSTI